MRLQKFHITATCPRADLANTFNVRLKSSSSSSAAPSSMAAPPSASGTVHTMQYKHTRQTQTYNQSPSTNKSSDLCTLQAKRRDYRHSPGVCSGAAAPSSSSMKSGMPFFFFFFFFSDMSKSWREGEAQRSVSATPSIAIKPKNIKPGATEQQQP